MIIKKITNIAENDEVNLIVVSELVNEIIDKLNEVIAQANKNTNIIESMKKNNLRNNYT